MKYKIMPKKKFQRKLDKAYDEGYLQGEADGQRQVVINIQNRVRQLNPEHPVQVAELKKWFGVD